VTRCAFFVLGIVAAAMTVVILDLLHMPHSLLVAGLTLVAAAEWLIARHRLVAAGIEEALGIAGLLMFAAEVLDGIGWSHSVTGALLIAAAFAIAGLRLLNPLFTTAAAVAVAIAFELAIETHSLGRRSGAATSAGLLSFAVAFVALALGAVRFRRPSYDRMLDWLVVLMPLAGYLWAADGHALSSPVDYLHKHAFADLLTPLEPLAFGLVALTVGVRRRRHAPLLAFMICTACLAFELRGLTGWSLEMRLVIWGGVTLAAAVALDRYLRTPRRGITSQKLSDHVGTLDLLQLAGSAAMTPHAQRQEATQTFQPGGGQFGGGGASGRY
jgi:hypothetical protein